MIMIKMKNHHILCIGIERIYMDGQCLEICLSAILRELKIYLKLVDFIENYNGDSDEGYFLEADVQFPEEQHTLHNNLSFLSKRMKIGKVEKLLAALYYLKGYVIDKKKPFKKFWIKSWVSI